MNLSTHLFLKVYGSVYDNVHFHGLFPNASNRGHIYTPFVQYIYIDIMRLIKTLSIIGFKTLSIIGFWMGLASALLIMNVVYMFIILRTNWDEQVRQASSYTVHPAMFEH